jgi:chromosome segregation ATPase
MNFWPGLKLFQALNILQQAKSLEVPTVDHETLEDQAVKVNREAKRIQEEAQRLISENAELLQAAQNKRVELEDLLKRAERQQQLVDSQLADMDGYRERAEDAVETGNNVLKDAQDTLSTLQG